MGQKENDGFSYRGAAALALTIKTYWRERGFPHVHTEWFHLPVQDVWVVRSNLVNGLPPPPVTRR